MAGVLSTARRPFDDLGSESNENKEQQHSEGPDKSEMVKLTMELFGENISPDDLRKVGESERAARLAFHLVAGLDHDFDRVQALRTSLNHLGARRNQGAIGDEDFSPDARKKTGRSVLTCIRYNI